MARPRYSFSILVVEDDIRILRQIVLHISKQFDRQVQILQANTFEQGKAIIEQGLFDIAIIDLGLPDGDGEGLIAMIREQSAYLPIIIQTTHDDATYQAKVHNRYEGLIYLTKDTLFEELAIRLIKAKDKHEMIASNRLAIRGYKKYESLDIDEVCYVTKVTDSQHLHVELYSFSKGEYYHFVIEYMTLTDFIRTYNATGYFLRCHNSCIVNRKMIRSFSRTDNQLTMLMPMINGNDVKIDVSQTYRGEVMNTLKGLY